jgi:hypothetical protein
LVLYGSFGCITHPCHFLSHGHPCPCANIPLIIAYLMPYFSNPHQRGSAPATASASCNCSTAAICSSASVSPMTHSRKCCQQERLQNWASTQACPLVSPTLIYIQVSFRYHLPTPPVTATGRVPLASGNGTIRTVPFDSAARRQPKVDKMEPSLLSPLPSVTTRSPQPCYYGYVPARKRGLIWLIRIMRRPSLRLMNWPR